jgi:molecular chaperone HtpG
MTEETTEETTEFEFKASVQRVLSLVINSLYTNSEVFLRELISNASDALDKARITALTSKDDVVEQEGEPAIDISFDPETNTLTIEDNGVGMTRDEAIENLGTIATSGTEDFVAKFAEATKEADKDKASELIGQFGVGFYACFMVASRVDVQTLSMKKGSEPVLWRSSGEGSFNVLPGEREKPGTTIVLHLKEDAAEFAQRFRVEQVIKRYSDFVMFPIRIGDDVVNRSSAIWRMPRSKVTDEQHLEFFKHITQGRAGDEPIARVHYSVDAPVQFSALLYVPPKATSDLFTLQQGRPGLRLYAKRVLIMESCEQLTPIYLRFACGVVDSEDLQLNVSRETLQENKTLKQIEQQVTKQLLKELGRLADDDETAYAAFWEQFGQILKEGLSTDWKNKDTIAELCRFESLSSDSGKLLSLKQYVDAKTEDQDAIWYITGSSRQQVERSPHLEVFRKKGIDVLLLCDPIDEWVVQALPTYGELELKSVVHGELELGEEVEEADKDRLETAAKAIAGALADKVDEVRLSSRLTDTASCLVSKAGDPGANLERIMKMLDDRAEKKSRVLEINPNHAFVQNIATLVERDKASPRVQVWADLLYDQALLSEGVVDDPAELVKRLQQLMIEASNAVLGDD